jgi:hypothetical protein
MMNKKGAVEFSITTIIIVIIGVALLALALPWISRTISQTSDLTDTAFDQAKAKLAGEVGPGNIVSVSPSNLRLRSNEQKTISIGCYNDASSVKSAKLPVNLGNGNGYTLSKSNDPKSDLAPGSKAYWGLVIKGISGVSSKTDPEVLSLEIECAGRTEIRPITITYE